MGTLAGIGSLGRVLHRDVGASFSVLGATVGSANPLPSDHVLKAYQTHAGDAPPCAAERARSAA